MSLGGTGLAFYTATPSGGTIVVLAVAVFVVAAGWTASRRRVLGRRHAPVEGHDAHEHGVRCGHPAVPHGDHVDYVHAGHRHAQHGQHYDDHDDHHDDTGHDDPGHDGPGPDGSGHDDALPAAPRPGR
ncbi:hypothetical protein GCM10025868_08600 [Angustibacter aerolatus]|uniref:Gram-positive cocci surface proteins LPxTG domain-containing protein n=1 Tax=Angustibacter aerolatus TaxID=1162965 RepID=A0ABQ6JEJ5_9ACTN|nr:hypothetical protein [Angustibacter aerolatus]GMA85610.1 hypothetical protein GCM10025868_08600 [Angustibacter aerolatus]